MFQFDFSFSGGTHRIAICDEARIPIIVTARASIVIASASEAIQRPQKDSGLLHRKCSSQRR
jgi:hypothetical protein